MQTETIVCIGASPTFQKHHPLFFAKPPPLPPKKSLQTVQAPFLGNSFLYIGFLGTPPPLKIEFFNDPHNIKIFHL